MKPMGMFPETLHFCSSHNCLARRAWVGFTSTTGESVWQNHDILYWNFISTREDLVRARRDMPGETKEGKAAWNPYVQEIIVY